MNFQKIYDDRISDLSMGQIKADQINWIIA